MAYNHYEIEEDSREAVFDWRNTNAPGLSISVPGLVFEPGPSDVIWMKFDYVPAETIDLGLSRKCRQLTGMVQVGFFFTPGAGTDEARKLANDFADWFISDRIIGQGYVYSSGEVRPTQKHEAGWFIPVRFAVRYDS